MKATILVPFRDKHDHKVVYAPGEVKEFDNDRVAALAARGLVKALEEAPKDPAEPKAKAPKGKGKGKSTKKEDAPAEVVADTDTDNAEADTEADVEKEAEADTENSTDNE